MGFTDLSFHARAAFGIDDCALMPLFTPELIALMRKLIPEDRRSCVASSLIVKGTKPPAR